MDDKFTYDSDFLIWTQQQAQALRALAKSRADLPNELDLEHVAEEIEDMGKSELNAVKSRIRNIMIHLIKAACDPNARAQPHWAIEVRAFHGELIYKVTPAMHARLDLPAIWRRARKVALADLAEFGLREPAGLPTDCPFTQEELISDEIDFAALCARVIPVP